MEKKRETLEEFFDNYNIDVRNMTYKEKLKLLREFIYNKKVDIDIMEMKIGTDSTKEEITQFIDTKQVIDVEIYRAMAYMSNVRFQKKNDKKEKVKKVIKQLIPTKRR